jgi:hypothetical protein
MSTYYMIVDNQAHSVIDNQQKICEKGIDLLLIRNPWGEGEELKKGTFTCIAQHSKAKPFNIASLLPVTNTTALPLHHGLALKGNS